MVSFIRWFVMRLMLTTSVRKIRAGHAKSAAFWMYWGVVLTRHTVIVVQLSNGRVLEAK